MLTGVYTPSKIPWGDGFPKSVFSPNGKKEYYWLVREFYAALEGPVVVGVEATGAMQWFLQLLEELGIECRVGHPAKPGELSEESRTRSGLYGLLRRPNRDLPAAVRLSRALT